MKRTDTVTKITAALLFIAILAYVGVYVLRSATGQVRTAPAVVSTVRETGAAGGIIIRNERVIESRMEYVNVTAEEGKRVSRGSVIAVAYGSDAALERANRIRELELEIFRAETLLSSLTTAEDLTARDTAVRSAVLGLSAAIARHDLTEIDRSSLNLRSLVFDSGEVVPYSKLEAMRTELAGLQSGYFVDTTELTAADSGLFSTILDGYEHLGAESLSGLKPDGLRALMEDRREVSAYGIGKLVSSFDWYFAAVMPREDAELLTQGQTASLEFGRHYGGLISARVADIGPAAGGERVVIFSCNEAMAGTLAMRQVSAEVIFDEYTGISVPKEAVRTDGDGNLYVFTLTAMQAEIKYVEIVYDAGDSYLMRPAAPPGADGGLVQDSSSYLREGNQIIIGGKDLYDGKVMD